MALWHVPVEAAMLTKCRVFPPRFAEKGDEWRSLGVITSFLSDHSEQGVRFSLSRAMARRTHQQQPTLEQFESLVHVQQRHALSFATRVAFAINLHERTNEGGREGMNYKAEATRSHFLRTWVSPDCKPRCAVNQRFLNLTRLLGEILAQSAA